MSSSQLSDISSVFGEVLRQHRVERNISQEELAYLAGVDRTFVSRLERGVRQPTITTLIGIGLALDIPAADLVKETEKEYLKHGDGAKHATMVREKTKQYRKMKKR